MTREPGVSVPYTKGLSVKDAALRYAQSGWTVLPVDAGSRDPASLLGRAWGKKSSSKPKVIKRWFRRWSDAGVALDLAKSGAAAFRLLDGAEADPSLHVLGIMLDGALLRRSGEGSDQGVYVLALPDGLVLQTGDYGPLRGSCEVLCAGEVLVVEPTVALDEVGVYEWRRTGALNVLPAELHSVLLKAAQRQSAATERSRAADEDAVLEGDPPAPARERPDHPNPGPHEPSSWAPRDLSRVLEGPLVALKASLMTRVDGVGLLYPGMVHTFFGEPESGKSLLMQWACVEALTAGLEVLYVDFESDPESVVGRLRSLGAASEHLRDRFTYVRPEDDLSGERDSRMWQHLLTRPFALAVIDGVTEGLDLFGFKSTDNENVARWMRTIPRVLAERTGAAVALIDHVTKSRESRGRFPVGAQAKLAAITGAAYMVESAVPLVGGGDGEYVLRVVKDRPGGVRRHAAAGTSQSRVIARVKAFSIAVPERGDALAVKLEPPGDGGSGSSARLTKEDLDQRILDAIVTHPGLTQTKLLDELGGNRPTLRVRLNELEDQGRVRTEPGPRNSRMYHPTE